jgi:NosR/NirI family nitrous oxide reductase transcriptional regulator
MRQSLFAVLAITIVLVLCAGVAEAASQLPRFLSKVEAAEIFPGADRIGPPEGDIPVAKVYKGDEAVGLVFLNSDFVNTIGYSGKPIDVVVAMDLDGKLTGAKLVNHSEPIVLIGIPEHKITTVIEVYRGLDIVAIARGEEVDHKVDIVSGATVTIMVIDDSIIRSAIKVARRFELGGLAPEVARAVGPKASLDPEQMRVADWQTLVGDGSLRRLAVSVDEINRAFEDSGDLIAAQRPEDGDPDEAFIEWYVAPVSVPSIGVSLLGEAEYRNLTAKLEPDQHAVLLMGRGRYSFKGSGYVRGGIFDRFQLIQGDNSVRFRDRQHKRLGRVAAAGAPEFVEVDIFRIPKGVAFDPTAPWRLEFLVGRETGPTSKAFVTFELGYRLPELYVKIEAPSPPEAGAEAAAVIGGPTVPLWQRLWRDKLVEVGILAVALSLLTILFFVQDWLVRRPRLTDWVRIGFLTFTLFGIGFYANAQLSVVNIMTFFNALISDFSWEYFLMEPLIFILWFSVAASLLFWGRGAFCGWLCPFGALLELSNRLAKLVRIPQLTVPWWLHERLWPVKYMLFLLLFGLSLYSLTLAEKLAEIEPFKTAIILKFMREWPFVLFAVSLVVAGLFIERFYCRYLCPLGAALAIPGRLRMFDWLKRYKECGSPCQRCRNECMVQAIHPEGHINPNECLYCLHCQVLYHHDQQCPVMIQRRLKRERRQALASKSRPADMAGKESAPKKPAEVTAQ